MAKKRRSKPKIKLVFRFDSPMMKLAMICLLILSTLTFTGLHYVISNENARLEALRTQAALLEQQKQKLEDKIGALGTQESVKDIAGDELGLADPNNKELIVEQQ